MIIGGTTFSVQVAKEGKRKFWFRDISCMWVFDIFMIAVGHGAGIKLQDNRGVFWGS